MTLFGSFHILLPLKSNFLLSKNGDRIHDSSFWFKRFYLKGIVPPGITMTDFCHSGIPYTMVELTGMVLFILFPHIALWLPIVLLGSS
ncbi:MAG: hypothetical protein A2Y79_10105 [Deltaproteobacteria bacterium RBG_13_43_22]|nr:MAG: hypothetical protein A2Y79_10105 [Deltaproteobacteria bacterium RBG_13_43_22]